MERPSLVVSLFFPAVESEGRDSDLKSKVLSVPFREWARLTVERPERQNVGFAVERGKKDGLSYKI